MENPFLKMQFKNIMTGKLKNSKNFINQSINTKISSKTSLLKNHIYQEQIPTNKFQYLSFPNKPKSCSFYKTTNKIQQSNLNKNRMHSNLRIKNKSITESQYLHSRDKLNNSRSLELASEFKRNREEKCEKKYLQVVGVQAYRWNLDYSQEKKSEKQLKTVFQESCALYNYNSTGDNKEQAISFKKIQRKQKNERNFATICQSNEKNKKYSFIKRKNKSQLQNKQNIQLNLWNKCSCSSFNSIKNPSHNNQMGYSSIQQNFQQNMKPSSKISQFYSKNVEECSTVKQYPTSINFRNNNFTLINIE